MQTVLPHENHVDSFFLTHTYSQKIINFAGLVLVFIFLLSNARARPRFSIGTSESQKKNEDWRGGGTKIVLSTLNNCLLRLYNSCKRHFLRLCSVRILNTSKTQSDYENLVTDCLQKKWLSTYQLQVFLG